MLKYRSAGESDIWCVFNVKEKKGHRTDNII